jgi:hypothetical protein
MTVAQEIRTMAEKTEDIAILEEAVATSVGTVGTPKYDDIAILEEAVATSVGTVGTPK